MWRILLISLSIIIKASEGIVDENDISYYLFTKIPDARTFICLGEKNASTIISNYFKSDVTVVFLIHGWTESRETTWYEPLKDAYLSNSRKYIVVQVDYAKPAQQFYLPAVGDTRLIGYLISKFVLSTRVPLKNIQVDGHSLGGQVAGFVGKYITIQSGEKLGRITALDPAGPLFFFARKDERLCESDAEVVVVVHTDAGRFGYHASCGTTDFWPNGGTDDIIGSCSKDEHFIEKVFCSHHLSFYYYIDSLKEGTDYNFIGTKCESYKSYLAEECRNNSQLNMGSVITSHDSGNYYFTINRHDTYIRKFNDEYDF